MAASNFVGQDSWGRMGKSPTTQTHLMSAESSIQPRRESAPRIYGDDEGASNRDLTQSYEDLSRNILGELRDLRLAHARIEKHILGMRTSGNFNRMVSPVENGGVPSPREASPRPSGYSSGVGIPTPLPEVSRTLDALDMCMSGGHYSSARPSAAQSMTSAPPALGLSGSRQAFPSSVLASSAYGSSRNWRVSSHVATSHSGSENRTEFRSLRAEREMRALASGVSFHQPHWLHEAVDPAKCWPKEIALRPALQELSTACGIVADQSLHYLKSFAKAADLKAFAKSMSLHEAASDKIKEKAWPRFVIHPNGRNRLIWDVFTLIFVVFDSITWPAALAWELEPQGWWLASLLAGAGLWTLDPFFQGMIAFFDADGKLVVQQYRLLVRYMRTRFTLDIALLLCDWVSVVVTAYEAAGNETSSALHRATRGLWMMKLCRLSRIHGIVGRVLDHMPPHWHSELTFGSTAVLAVIVWLNHFGACCWFAVGLRADGNETGRSWLDEPFGQDLEPLSQAPVMYQYFSALHWSASQMTFGQNELHPQNIAERIFGIVCLLLGVICFSFLVSALTAQVVDALHSQQEARAVLSSLRQFLSSSGIRTMLRLRVEREVERALKVREQPLRISEVACLASLPNELRMELRCALSWPYVSAKPLWKLLSMIDGNTMQRICGEWIDFQAHSQGDTIFSTGATAQHMYVLKHGELLYTWTAAGETQHEQEKLMPVSWLCEVALWAEWSHVGTATAVSDAEVLAIHAEMFLISALKSRLLRDFVVEYGCLFHTRLGMAIPPQADLPTDTRVPCTDFHELLMVMHTDLRIFVGLVGVELLRQRRQALFHSQMSERLNELEREVCSGRCVLTLNDAGEAERISLVTVLRLANSTGELLVQLGKWSLDTGIEVLCRLPGQQQNAGEGPEVALRKLMDGKLAPFVGGIRLGSSEQTVELRESKHFGISTRYLQNIRMAQFEASFEIPVTYLMKQDCEISPAVELEGTIGPFSSLKKQHGERLSARITGNLLTGKRLSERRISHPMIRSQVFAVALGTVVYFFSWLQEEEMDFLNTPIGEQHLHATLEELRHEAEVLQRVCSYGWNARNLSPTEIRRSEDMAWEAEPETRPSRPIRTRRIERI